MARIKRPLQRRGISSSPPVRLLRAIMIVVLITFTALFLRQGESSWYKHTAKHRQKNKYNHGLFSQSLRDEPNEQRVAFTLANLKKQKSGDDDDDTEGVVIIETVPSWAPRGVTRFWQLVSDQEEAVYQKARFFRVLPRFVAQFGIAGNPQVAQRWQQDTIRDDPRGRASNTVGTVTFAMSGKDTRTTQLFINLQDNRNLDKEGFTPIGRVVEGMEYVYRIQDEHGETPDQHKIQQLGNAYLQEHFPSLSYIKSVQILG